VEGVCAGATSAVRKRAAKVERVFIGAPEKSAAVYMVEFSCGEIFLPAKQKRTARSGCATLGNRVDRSGDVL
jgi:hypothetical protein